MGLYDNVRVDAPLPGSPSLSDDEAVFQTKDFEDPCLNNYRITKDGRLMLEPWNCQDKTPPADQHYHGNLNFYTLTDNNKYGLEYEARFTDGKLQEIKLVADDRPKDS